MATLNAKSVSGQFNKESNETTLSVSFVYNSTEGKTGAVATLDALGLVPEKPPGADGPNGQFNLKTCSASPESAHRSVFNVQATYSDLVKNAKDDADGGGKGNDGGGGGGRGGCKPPGTETTSTVRAMKDYPINNHCGEPILPSPQIEVTMIQRTVTTYEMETQETIAKTQNDLANNMGKIDVDETNLQNIKRGIDLRNVGPNGLCKKEKGAPAIGDNEQEREKNAPCGSMLTGGGIGAPQKGPCGNYVAITKTFVDGNFRAPRHRGGRIQELRRREQRRRHARWDSRRPAVPNGRPRKSWRRYSLAGTTKTKQIKAKKWRTKHGSAATPQERTA